MGFSKINAKRVLLPFIKTKDLRPVSNLLSPSNLLVPMSLIVILGQITENLKGILIPKDIQQIPSVKLYTKVLNIGYNSVALSAINSISKTLGPELETLSVLNVQQRLNYLKDLQNRIILDRGPGRISTKSSIFYDSFELAKHRRGLSMQCRSVLVASPIYATNTLVIGLPINQVDIKTIVDSCKLIWGFLGLDYDEFDFLARKHALSCYKNIYGNEVLGIPDDIYNALKIIVLSELRHATGFDGKFLIHDDSIVLNCDSNLTLVENEFLFIRRTLPELPKDVFISDYELKDGILRAAIEQRRNYNSKLHNIFKVIGTKKKSNLNGRNSLKLIKSKKLLLDS
uniref:putative group II intron reverse transcriptase/maturase mat5 n=1 Tax=Strombomonas costata TaxID=161230 RepID=UPI0023AA82CC|nr:putative group II intron reverse transcriptase/maturase mat5 [Strombomonas costata]WCH63641.1 putative group II intron reverse transcriptase/maturase mat5 [Strombomonas costata]